MSGWPGRNSMGPSGAGDCRAYGPAIAGLEFHERLARPKQYGTLRGRRLPGIRAGVYTEHRRRKIRHPDQTLAGHDDGSLQNIAQLPHITGPIVPMKKVEHFGIDPCDARAVFPVQILQHDIGDRRDIFFMVAQWRNHNLEYTQPVVKLLAQMRSEFLTGRGENPGVYHDFVLAAEAPHSQVLDHPQQLDRKSTRLNSSHRCISYAVFCL